MFGPNPGAFGQTSTAGGFGSNTATESPFGQTSISGKPAMGGVQPAEGGLFVAPAITQQSAFGAFGQQQQQTTSLLGTQKNTAPKTSLFENDNNNLAFGAFKPAGCGQPAAETAPGQASTSQTAQRGGLFGAKKPAFGGVAKPMSLKPVPVCSSCNRSTGKCIFCTSCYEMCCVICFNLQTDLTDAITKDDSVETVRLCPKCIGSIGIKQEPLDQPCTSAMDQDSELCELHGKPHKLFCLNCSTCICGDCLSEKQHELHHFNNLVVVYQEELADVELKLADAEKQLASSSVYERNLEKLEKEEQSIMKAVLIMKQKSISGLSNLTTKRKEKLKSKVQFYADKRKRLSKLRETVKTLTAKDFLTKRSVIDRQCDAMMIGFTPKCDLESVDDFKCDLVPSYTFADLKCTAFTTATSKFTRRINSAYDVAWDVTVSKSLTALHVKLNPTDATIFKFGHKLVVIIPHKDPTKEIRKTFDLGSACNTFEMVEMSHLTEHGFFNEGGNISLNIGVRPLDALVEKMLLSYNCEKLKDELARFNVENSNLKADSARLNVENLSLKNESASLKTQLESITSAIDYKFYTSHFMLPLANLNANFQQFSTNIVDEDGRWWGLKVLPTLFYQYPQQVEAYITLICGSPAKCNFFIELKHKDAQKTITKLGSSNFNERATAGWNCFITWNQILDVGFHPDGNLRFRFGVKPLPN